MGLEILAQHQILRDGGAHKLFCRDALWVDGVGLIGTWLSDEDGAWFYGAVQLDGELIYIDRKPSVFSSSMASYQQDFLTGRELVIYQYGFGGIWLTDGETNIWSPYVYDGDLQKPLIAANMVRLSDRWLKVMSQNVYWAPLDETANWEIEHTIVGGSPSGYPTISSAGGGNVWLIYPDGDMALYSIVNKQAVSTNGKMWPFGSSYIFEGAWWSEDLEVFIALANDATTGLPYIWTFSDEVRPYSLSDPIALSTLQKGYVTQMEVTLTGEHSDPVADFPIDWSITSGTGALSAGQSITDSDGKAKIAYIPSSTAPSSFTLEAEATF